MKNEFLPSLRVIGDRLDNIHATDALSFHLFAMLLEVPKLIRENPRLWHKRIVGQMRCCHPTTNFKNIMIKI